MLSLALSGVAAPLERVLVIGCHADDVEIGCGATLAVFLQCKAMALSFVRSDGQRPRAPVAGNICSTST